MCRHLAYLGPPRPLAELLTAPPHSLYEQSYTPTVNADGFGIGWYPPDDGAGPVRYRRAVPIWADANLPGLAAVISSGAVLAAVRSATPGTSHDESAAAPFALGRWLFSHNGAVDRWDLLPADTGEPLTAAELLGMEAHSDSALLWIMAGRRLTAGRSPGEALADVARRTLAARPAARLNFLLTDGNSIAATRHGDTLWYRPAGREVTVASSPDTDEPGWQEVPDHSLLLATRHTAEIAPL
ncbi:ergothioneine biosynthesis protein EgtC [Streptomyces litchfieldiae]|uniref:Gamma-glutamyl-hercynylcysteine sulfoxide hydrolase n=1 Tax=Streptomyces litchfieldiae TaxID=3075543 RepID=A0ABU2MNB1_9ACTN|nr:ergothioneine biosynthesis protein EgtC [Streptomyces sp. DSM 44938]MDT0343101.1 ergothioneine biosynthesis protein EgtC [Streptomyces sp. DSM 44938]